MVSDFEFWSRPPGIPPCTVCVKDGMNDVFTYEIDKSLKSKYQLFDINDDHLDKQHTVLFFSPLIATTTLDKNYMLIYRVEHEGDLLMLSAYSYWVFFKRNRVLRFEETGETPGATFIAGWRSLLKR